ncbi:tetratricopeptide repeat protein [Pseudohalocynthiibacter aestuariivivens]|uniref:Tetratricopeptide repeat protein n=1 Tax=Pseudohalocynthiibacter aestuariivivens TaxID=1591409 RepID=A0ABV5JGM1_9RHOB|nr:tetratricopeptide repeat protein [Pseudohalocynthiibacter aestuariivivens]MBS9719029.1 tetratricopeptide repeat protein [Pseudohalocynthiibacter aestuariivivens]
MGLSQDTIAEKCRFHAETALDLDDTNPVVHAYASMAFGFSPLAEKERGLKHSSIAATLNPNDCELMLLHAWQLAFAGNHEQAIALLRRVSLLNPLGDYMIAECFADTYYMMGDYEKALESYNDQGDAPPQSQAVFAACHAQMGRLDEAHACLLHLYNVKPVGFDVEAFVAAQCITCLREDDRNNWLNGFRRAGVDI